VPTVSDIARQTLNRVAIDGGLELAAQYVADRLTELFARAKFRALRQYGQTFLRAPIGSINGPAAGTVLITAGSTDVVGDATALAAWQASQLPTGFGYPDGFQGLWFRPQMGQTWYRIAQVEGAHLTLETPFAQDNSQVFANGSPAPNITYYIVPRYVELAPDARQLGVFVCDFMYRPLQLMSEDQLNVMAPNRFWVWAYPQIVAELNSNLDKTGQPKVVEIYPWPVSSVTMHYTYWSTPPRLSLDDVVPPTIDQDILRTGAIADACRNAMGKAIKAGNLEQAAMWRNEAMTEETQWERKVGRAIRNDRGAEDVKLLLKRGWRQFPVDWDPVKTAYQNFLARGY
jgi:hypothetical protein